jgi:hypothetical protein
MAPPLPKVETALDWFQRSQRKRAAARTPTDPSSAAWNFVRCGTSGIAPIDAAWKTPSANPNLPIVVVEGTVGKTWTLISLAARFVVATRPSRFARSRNDDETPPSQDEHLLPQVVLLDSNYDVTIRKIAQVVRATLLRQQGMNNEDDGSLLEQDLECCLGRIHIATVDNLLGWVPVLECLRYKLKQHGEEQLPPTTTLVLWDGLLSESSRSSYDSSQKMEVLRQVSRLLQDCPSIALVVTVDHHRTSDWISNWQRERELHRVRLERRSGKDCFAVVNGSKVPFSLSLGGILS